MWINSETRAYQQRRQEKDFSPSHLPSRTPIFSLSVPLPLPPSFPTPRPGLLQRHLQTLTQPVKMDASANSNYLGQGRNQLPVIDFTLHTMEDGREVSTQERVCKGSNPLILRVDSINIPMQMYKLLLVPYQPKTSFSLQTIVTSRIFSFSSSTFIAKAD